MAAVARRVCLFTGAGGRLGSAFCRLYASRYQIAAVCRNRVPDLPTQQQCFTDPLNPAARLPENEHPLFAVRADLASDRELDRVVELVLARFGRIDVVVNAARVPAFGHTVDSTRLLDTLEAQFNVNALVPLKLAVRIAREFWRNRDLENRQEGRNVINVSSVAALRLTPGRGHSAYGAAKAALNLLTLHMAHEFQDFGVRVNACAPDSFPAIVSVESVAECLWKLDQSRVTGKIVVIGKGGERILPEEVPLLAGAPRG
jgi:NAD(P)-dependent dehydrogenase (short-subunit alcohol dehydrogenase family)